MSTVKKMFKWLAILALAGSLAGCGKRQYSVESRVIHVERQYTDEWIQFVQIGNIQTPIIHPGYYTKYIWVVRPETLRVEISDLEPAQVGDTYWIRRPM